jgi:hypothetical protein
MLQQGCLIVMFRPADDPIRPGNRGGHDNFEWESIRNDKQKDRYLGNSVKMPTGKWMYGRDLFWYGKTAQEKGEYVMGDKQNEDGVQREMERIREQEEELMNARLNIRKKEAASERQAPAALSSVAAQSVKEPASASHVQKAYRKRDDRSREDRDLRKERRKRQRRSRSRSRSRDRRQGSSRKNREA